MARGRRENRTDEPAEGEEVASPERAADADDNEASKYAIRFESLKLVKKNTAPSPYVNIDLLADLGMPSPDELIIANHYDNLTTLMEKIRATAKNDEPPKWFKVISEEIKDRRKTLLLIIGLKVTLLGTSTKDSIRGWEIPKEIPVSSQDLQEVKSIEGLFAGEAVRKKNIEKVEECLEHDFETRENNREILLNIAFGNVMGESYLRYKKQMVKVV